MTLWSNISDFFLPFCFVSTKKKDRPWMIWKGLYLVLLTAQMVVKLQGLEAWDYISQLRRALSNSRNCTQSETSKSKWLGREIVVIEVQDISFPPRHQHGKLKNVSYVSFHSSFLIFGCSSSVAQLCLILGDLMDCSTPSFPVHHQLLELTQTHVHRVGVTIQPSYPLLSSSPPAFDLSQYQALFQGVSFSHQVAKVLEFQLQYQSFQWTFRTDFL